MGAEQGWNESFDKLAESLKGGIADFMGYSLGGGVALKTAVRHPELVHKLVIVSAPCKQTGWYPEVLASMALLAGGHGEADTTDALCEQLIDRYTVVTYDRRGLSRSAIDSSAELPTIAMHSDDAHQLLSALTTEPSLVFGSSIDALIGLNMVARHPKQVSVLVAHEPPAWELLPDAERDRANQALDDVVNTFHREGTIAAFQKFAVLAAIDPTDREPDVALSTTTPQIAANMNFFFANDAPGVNNFRLDIAALKVTSTRIVAAGGRSGRESSPHRCAAALAAKLSTTFVEFPGGHTGWLLRPKGFAAKLLEVLKRRDY